MSEVREQLIERIPDFIWVAGDGRGRGETYDRMLDRAARKTGIPYTRLWAYWYRKVKKPLAEEYVILLHWAALKADAKTNALMGELDRSKKDVADAAQIITRAAFPSAADDLQRDCNSLFGTGAMAR